MRTLLCTLLLAAASLAADVTGTWTFAVETSAGSGSPTFVLKQAGETLSGTYSGALGQAPVKGSVKGDDIVIRFEASAGGEKLACEYRGKVQSGTKMKGTVELGTLANGTFTATKN